MKLAKFSTGFGGYAQTFLMGFLWMCSSEREKIRETHFTIVRAQFSLTRCGGATDWRPRLKLQHIINSSFPVSPPEFAFYLLLFRSRVCFVFITFYLYFFLWFDIFTVAGEET